MRGITNAPQGSGGSGGTWSLRALNSDWSDIFDVTGQTITAKKDILISYASSYYAINYYIPKGTSSEYQIKAIASGIFSVENNKITVPSCLDIATGRISSGTSFNLVVSEVTATTDGSSITYAITSSNKSLAKSSLIVHTRD